MKDEVEKYENMFDTTKCEQLINKVESDEATFKRIQEELKGEKFFDQSLATAPRRMRYGFSPGSPASSSGGR